MRSAVRFKHTQVARQQGELARLKVIQGPDYGAVYIVMGKKVKMGRGEENDIVISDLKASRFHAELNLQDEKWIVRDHSSSNGILYNGKNVKEAVLKIQDTLTIGESTLEFTTSDIGTVMLVAPPRTTEQVHLDLKNFNEQKKKIQNIFTGQSYSSEPNASSPKKFFIYGIVAILFLIFFMYDSGTPPSQKSSAKKKDATADFDKNLATYLPNVVTNRTIETLFKEGQREFFAGNYNRARKQFETVLQVSPGHPLANLYLQNCMKSVDEEVRVHLEYGKKSLDAGKLRDSKSHFDRIMRLLYRDQTNPAYIEAKEQYSIVENKINETGVDK